MELRPSSPTASCAATQEFPNILWNPNVHCRVHKSPQPVPTLSQMNPAHSTPFCLSKIHLLLSSRLRLGLPNGLFPSVFPTKIIWSFHCSPMHATFPAHLILLDVIILIIIGEEHKSTVN
jgi:hypothetical protein